MGNIVTVDTIGTMVINKNVRTRESVGCKYKREYNMFNLNFVIMKKILFLFALLLCIGQGAWAQTKVTGTVM